MKIGHYDSELWEHGGVANYMRRVGAAQVALGHEVVYFSLHPPEGRTVEFDSFVPVLNTVELFTQAEALGLDILHVHKAVSSPQSSSVPLIRTLHGHHPYCPSGGRYLQRWQKPCDRAYHPLGCLVSRFSDRCGSVRPHKIQDSFRHTWREMRTLPHIQVMAVSQFLKDQMVRSGYPPEKIQVLHLFAPKLGNSEPPPNTDTPHFLFLGRITPNKGIEWLLRSFQQISVPAHLDIAGDGDTVDQTKQLVEQLGIQDKVTFHGWVSADHVGELIDNSRALIFPSVWHEPGGTVAFEAMANARPVIMSRVGGMPEVVLHNINGLVVEPWNIRELKQSIELLATDWNYAQKLGIEGRKLVEEEFSAEDHLNVLMGLYEKLVASFKDENKRYANSFA